MVQSFLLGKCLVDSFQVTWKVEGLYTFPKFFLQTNSTDFFSIVVILLFVIFAWLILEKTKKFDRNNIILSKDVDGDKNIAASILLFGAVANTSAHLFASRVDSTILNDDIPTLLTGVILLLLFFVVRFVKAAAVFSKLILAFGFLMTLAHNVVDAYFADLHPFYFAAILIVLGVTPVVFVKLPQVIKFISGLMLTSVILVVLVDEPVYDPYLFLIGIAVMSVVVLLLIYIRNNSLERLIFTSGVVNKGNVLVVAFDKESTVNYVSENLTEILDIHSYDLIGKPIALLNRFQPEVKEYKMFANVDLKNEFAEGKVFVSPLYSKRGDIVFYQWSCKSFSDDIRVVLGQDVTEKVNLERYYEIIVSSADDLIFQTDPSGYFTFLNEKCLELFGKTENEIIGKHWSVLVHPNYRENAIAFYVQQFKSRYKTTFYEFPVLDVNGDVKWLGQKLTTLFKPGSESWVKGYLGLARDITQRRMAQLKIQEQNSDIKDSMNYAKRIQFNMLPKNEIFEQNFKDYFVLFKPRDIVSGDFYWMERIGEEVVLACVDCTGHGVPGAFMTLLGINSLNEIVKERKITQPNLILNELDKRIIKDLSRKELTDRVNDGMAVSLVTLNSKKKSITFSTAGGRLAVFQAESRELNTFRLNAKHIGDIEDDFQGYELGELNYKEEDILYLFTDGFQDQFGGPKNKKVKIDQFLQLLVNSRNSPLMDQQLFLNQFLNDWMGEEDQTDDITVIGVKGIH